MTLPTHRGAQRALLASAKAAESTALIAATGGGFRDHVESAFGKAFQWLRFRVLMAAAFQGLIDGTLRLPDGSRADKLYFAAPPQSGKSTMVQLGASHILCEFPGVCVGAAMHNRDKTIRFAKMVRRFTKNAGMLVPESAVHNWVTASGSEFWACGKGTSPSGLPAQAIFTDDLISGKEEAENRGVFQGDLDWLAGERTRVAGASRPRPVHYLLDRHPVEPVRHPGVPAEPGRLVRSADARHLRSGAQARGNGRPFPW